MSNTIGDATVDVLRQRVCLFVPSVTVCIVVCLRFMTYVTHTGQFGHSDELWRFSTSTDGWERVDNTTTNGTGPIGRTGHVMTSVGLDLWIHGGETNSGKGDKRGTHVLMFTLIH
jgi:hypothetical protein